MKMVFVLKPDPTPSTPKSEKRQRDVSGQLVRLIDILFGLVIVQGALFYRPILAAHGTRNWAVVLALALVMYTVVRSFVDWHTLMERNSYKISTSTAISLRPWLRGALQARTLDLWRLYVDFVIVAVYSVMLLRAHVLLGSPAAGLRLFFWLFPGLFLLYLAWGELLRLRTGTQEFEEGLLLAAIAASGSLAALYNVAYASGWLADHGMARNIFFLTTEFVIMVLYRCFNWEQTPTTA
jgi:hypothetical protein